MHGEFRRLQRMGSAAITMGVLLWAKWVSARLRVGTRSFFLSFSFTRRYHHIHPLSGDTPLGHWHPLLLLLLPPTLLLITIITTVQGLYSCHRALGRKKGAILLPLASVLCRQRTIHASIPIDFHLNIPHPKTPSVLSRLVAWCPQPNGGGALSTCSRPFEAFQSDHAASPSFPIPFSGIRPDD